MSGCVTSSVKLSVCIATYNRGRYIGETLLSLVGQMPAEMELVVVDGASTDDTPERVSAIQSAYPRIRYYRELENSGVDRDFDKAICYAKGEYVWLMTDDDIALDGALSRISSAVGEGHDLIVVNSEVMNSDLSRVLCGRLLDIQADRQYSVGDHERFFADIASTLTFIGSVILRRELWLSRQRRDYFGSLFVHVGVVFQSPPIARIRVLAEPVLRIRYGVAMWTPRSFEVWMYKWPDLIWSFQDYSEATKTSVTLREPWRRASRLFYFRSKRAYTINEYRTHFAHVSGWWFRYRALCISVFPVFVANLLSTIYVVVRSPRNRIPLFDLVNAHRSSRLKRWLARLFSL